MLDGLNAWAAFGASLTVIVSAVVLAVRWAVTVVVNGRLDRIDSRLQGLDDWTVSHDRRHGHEQRQIIAALERQGISAPDGWDL